MNFVEAAPLCPLLAHTLGQCLECVAAEIVTKLPAISRANPLKEAHLRAGSRLARIDEDYRRAVAQRKEAASLTSLDAVAAVDGDLGDARRTTQRWTDRTIQKHVADAWETHDEKFGTVHCVASDGARLGNPAEETVTYLRWNSSLRKGHWFLSQVGLRV